MSKFALVRPFHRVDQTLTVFTEQFEMNERCSRISPIRTAKSLGLKVRRVQGNRVACSRIERRSLALTSSRVTQWSRVKRLMLISERNTPICQGVFSSVFHLGFLLRESDLKLQEGANNTFWEGQSYSPLRQDQESRGGGGGKLYLGRSSPPPPRTPRWIKHCFSSLERVTDVSDLGRTRRRIWWNSALEIELKSSSCRCLTLTIAVSCWWKSLIDAGTTVASKPLNSWWQISRGE